MNDLPTYLIEYLCASGLLYLGYLMTRTAIFPKYKRVLLLVCLMLPLLLPFFKIKTLNPSFSFSEQLTRSITSIDIHQSKVSLPLVKESLDTKSGTGDSSHSEITTQANWSRSSVILCLYSFVVFTLLMRMTISLLGVVRLKRQSSYQTSGSYYLSDNHRMIGGSFFHWIFISSRMNQDDLEHILKHEKIHAQKIHSLDILIVEFITSVLWINPFNWLLKQEIRLNHEFEVDGILAKNIGTENYSNLLVQLTTFRVSAQTSILNTFSLRGTKKRIHQVYSSETNNWQRATLFLPSVIFAFWISSCEPDSTERETVYSGSPIKTITTTFVSHQNDTDNKDMKTVAVANFLPDGILDKVIQHMTYPYNIENPYNVKLWGQTDADAVPIILDGLSLDIAENNFLYGNDWPAEYAMVTQKEHPKFKKGEVSGYRTNLKMYDDKFPSKIVSEEIDTPKPYFTSSNSFFEEFEYEQDKIISFREYVEMDRPIVEKIDSKLVEKGRKKSTFNEQKFAFEYTGDLLTKVSDGRIIYEFNYEGTQLSRAKYYLGGKLYNTRKYYYTDNGLKERTEIFNVNGDPEYTIHYHYKFY
ncbi:MAG: hypothetical protein RIC35_17075 [Marinoscillum sp.]